jgi:hypothetical protein
MEKKLSFNDGMENLRSQKRQNDPAWGLKELELKTRKRTLDNTYELRANVLLESNDQDFKDGFQLAFDCNDAIAKAFLDYLVNKKGLSKSEMDYRFISVRLNKLFDDSSESFKEGFFAGKSHNESKMFELGKLIGEYYPAEE